MGAKLPFALPTNQFLAEKCGLAGGGKDYRILILDFNEE